MPAYGGRALSTRACYGEVTFVLGRIQGELGAFLNGFALLHMNIDLTRTKGGPHQKGVVIPLLLASESLVMMRKFARRPIAVVVEPISADLLVANLGMCGLSIRIARLRLGGAVGLRS